MRAFVHQFVMPSERHLSSHSWCACIELGLNSTNCLTCKLTTFAKETLTLTQTNCILSIFSNNMLYPKEDKESRNLLYAVSIMICNSEKIKLIV